MAKRTLNLTKEQWDFLKEMLYDDTQLNRYNRAASRAIYEKIEMAKVTKITAKTTLSLAVKIADLPIFKQFLIGVTDWIEQISQTDYKLTAAEAKLLRALEEMAKEKGK